MSGSERAVESARNIRRQGIVRAKAISLILGVLGYIAIMAVHPQNPAPGVSI